MVSACSSVCAHHDDNDDGNAITAAQKIKLKFLFLLKRKKKYKSLSYSDGDGDGGVTKVNSNRECLIPKVFFLSILSHNVYCFHFCGFKFSSLATIFLLLFHWFLFSVILDSYAVRRMKIQR